MKGQHKGGKRVVTMATGRKDAAGGMKSPPPQATGNVMPKGKGKP